MPPSVGFGIAVHRSQTMSVADPGFVGVDPDQDAVERRRRVDRRIGLLALRVKARRRVRRDHVGQGAAIFRRLFLRPRGCRRHEGDTETYGPEPEPWFHRYSPVRSTPVAGSVCSPYRRYAKMSIVLRRNCWSRRQRAETGAPRPKPAYGTCVAMEVALPGMVRLTDAALDRAAVQRLKPLPAPAAADDLALPALSRSRTATPKIAAMVWRLARSTSAPFGGAEEGGDA